MEMNGMKGSMLPTLVLLVLYIIADTLFPPLYGAFAMLVLGAVELGYAWWRESRFDWLVCWTTLLFALPGLSLLVVEDGMPEWVQPLLFEGGFCLLAGIFAYSRADLNAMLPASARSQIQLSPAQQKSMRNTLKTLCWLMAGHVVLAVLARFRMEGAAASFIGGPLLYILLAAWIVFLFIRRSVILARMKKEEWLPIVDEKGKVLGKASRSLCHSGCKLMHPVVHLHILDGKGGVFLQKRSMKKKLLPGKWDTAVGGHIGFNEKVEDALKRETSEELGIGRMEARFLGNYVWESDTEKELVFSFLCTSYDRIHIDNDEVDEGRFWTGAEIEEGIRRQELTPNFIHEYRLLLGSVLKNHK